MEKVKELRGVSLAELSSKIVEKEEHYHKLIMAHGVDPIENPMRIRKTRREIARLKTIINEQKKSKN